MHNKKPLALALAGVLTTTSHAAFAQETPAADKSPSLEEVLVTAQRRAENIQDVPMTVTAITGENIADYKIFEFQGLSQLAPGLVLDNNGAFG